MEGIAKILMFAGISLFLAGLLIYILNKFGLQLPGDILIRRENSTFYFPIMSCIVISLILTVILNFFRR